MPVSETLHYFPSTAEFRAWLEENHDKAPEVTVVFYRKSTGKPTMTWSEAVDVAICFGWIDGVRHRIDDERFTNRFTPRRPGSNWSAINIKKVEQLSAAGLMHPAGIAAFENRREDRSGVYSFEQENIDLPPEYRFQLYANPAAAAFFDSQPKSYRRPALWWVLSAKREETRQRRLAILIEDSAAGRRISMLRRPTKES